MLEKILGKAVYLILERLITWAAREVSQWVEELNQDSADKAALEKLQQAKTKEKKLRRAKDLIDSITKP